MYITAGACILVSALLCSAVADTTVKPVDTTNDDINSVDFKHQNPTDVAKQIWEKRCGRQYNIGCLKMDLVKLIDRLDENTNFQILPGVSIVRSASSGIGMPTEMLLGKPDSFLDNYLVSKFTNYLSTLTINVKILDPALVSTAKSFGEGIFGADPETTGTARRKNRFGQTMAVAGMMSGATLLAMGMSALAAMAGKALMTSLLSLMLSAISALKGHGDGHKSTTYEIVTRPVVTHAHSHSSEVQHLTGHGGHTAHDGGYGYARSMASTPVQPVVQDEIYQKYTASIPDAEGDRMAYRAHEPLPSYASLPTVS